MKFDRKKKRNLMLSFAYLINRLFQVSAKWRLKLYLDLAWIFSRLAHEQFFNTSFKIEGDIEEDFLLKKINSNDKILDVGCGKGRVIESLIPITNNITGVDFDESAIIIAEKIIKEDIVLICDDIFNYLNKNINEKFDVIILSHVLEHIDDPSSFLKTLTTRSKFLYIEVPDLECTHLNVYRQLVNTDLIYSDADHVYEFNRNELEKIIKSVGFEVISSEFRFGVMKYWCQSKI